MVYHRNLVAVVKVNGRVLRESEGVVHLPFNSEYTILVKNKDSRRVVIDVEINGENALSKNKIIVAGNESMELQGFMNSSGKVTNKFKFIEKTSEISDYRGDDPEDGMIRISYQFEIPQKQVTPFWIKSQDHAVTFPYPIQRSPSLCDHDLYSSRPIFASCSQEINCCASASSSQPNFNTRSIDGLTVPGSKSDQSFKSTSIGVLESEVNVICFQLKGGSPLSGRINESIFVRTKKTCLSCGKKWDQDFCGSCGTALKAF